MKRGYKVGLSTLLGVVVVSLAWLYLHDKNIAVLQPSGSIAAEQYNLIVFTTVLSLIVILPVFGLLVAILWRFRASNTKAKYRPNWDGSKVLESIWWGLPFGIIVVLSVVIWTSTHALDPYRALDSRIKPVEIQVVALQWKWLFIYPDEKVATVNQLYIPTDTPVNFTISADAPMNSLWIPKLGGQVYAMSGMSTKLHLMADEVGDYEGSSANISGKGFAGMKFMTHATTQDEYGKWLIESRSSSKALNDESYNELAKPSENVKPETYKLTDADLYDTIVMKYMDSGHGMGMEGMEH